MTEEKIKNRGWVKNAAIIFLSVMLVLTFFSNTIMNRSLPEVSAQYAQSGTITTRIRGSGAIEATETFEVKSEDSRKVKSVAITTGQEVAVGDLLFVLAEGDSTELESARKTLEDLQYNYEVALINAGETDENGENAAIVRAREKLEAAIATRDANYVTNEDVSIAKTALVTATANYNKAKENLEAAGGASTGSSGDYSIVQAAKEAMDKAKTAYDAALIQFSAPYAVIKSDAVKMHNEDDTYSVESYMQALAAQHEATDTADYTDFDGNPVAKPDGGPNYTWGEIVAAYTSLTGAESTYETAKYYYNTKLNDYYESYIPNNSALVTAVSNAKAIMDSAQETYDSLVAMQTTYETAKDSVVSYQEALENAIRAQRLESLDLKRLQSQIAEAGAKVSELSGTGGAGGSIYAEVAGVVKTISVTAGNTTDPNSAMATIEVPDRGYSLSLTVTKEQAQKVSVGDSADISTGWWGSSGLSGKLVRILPDPTAPNQNKILVFEVQGDVESGTNVTVSIGQKSKSFEVIVPNSAVREDSNGSFVLVVVAKSTPLGNRYIATRADVQVLAEDDTNTAVSGGIYAGDFVITTSTKPLESGMQVRLADN